MAECTKNDIINEIREDIKINKKEIVLLKVDQSAIKTEIKNLISSLRGLTTALWGFIITMISILTGFFIWYIQTH